MNDLNDAFSALQLSVSAFEEDFIKGREKGAGFADMVSKLGNANDEDERQIVEQACLSVLKRRIDILGKAIRLVDGANTECKPEIEPFCKGDF